VENGQVVQIRGSLQDITERKQLEEQFIQAQKMEAIGRLAGGVAHDFNNLLTVINGYCDLLLLSDLPVGDPRRESVSTIRDAGERAAGLTQQLLAFSRKAMIEPKVIDLNELVSESSKLLRRLIGEDIVLAVITAPTPTPVKVDPGQFEQVLMNLVVNARDAMPRGGRLTIETSARVLGEGDANRFVRLSVSDTGSGMTEEVKGKIFEPFFTTKEVGKGTGLGLAVVHGVINQGGGEISIESSVGAGTTFHILLPLVSPTQVAPVPETVATDTRGTETVLLVEDEKTVRRIARLALETKGYTVLEAEHGAAALQLIQLHPGEIHLLLSDVIMPEMGGRQLLEEVRRCRPGLRALFMSGYTDDAVLRHGVIHGTDAFLQKPFTPLVLAKKVREVLDAVAAG
jgi:nitrogen-specific signal transduction histidine kinase